MMESRKSKSEDCDYDFEKGDELSDVKILVENKYLWAHKAILATASPVFKSMFTLGFKENQTGELLLPGKRYDDILELLKTIYPNFSKNIDDSNQQILLTLSDEYCITSLKNRIEKMMIMNLSEMFVKKAYGKKMMNDRLNQVLEKLELALKYELKKLKSQCVISLAEQFDKKQLEQEARFQEIMSIEPDVHFAIMSHRVDWLEEQIKDNMSKMKKLGDENLRQKFEINRLESLIGSSN